MTDDKVRGEIKRRLRDAIAPGLVGGLGARTAIPELLYEVERLQRLEVLVHGAVGAPAGKNTAEVEEWVDYIRADERERIAQWLEGQGDRDAASGCQMVDVDFAMCAIRSGKASEGK